MAHGTGLKEKAAEGCSAPRTCTGQLPPAALGARWRCLQGTISPLPIRGPFSGWSCAGRALSLARTQPAWGFIPPSRGQSPRPTRGTSARLRLSRPFPVCRRRSRESPCSSVRGRWGCQTPALQIYGPEEQLPSVCELHWTSSLSPPSVTPCLGTLPSPLPLQRPAPRGPIRAAPSRGSWTPAAGWLSAERADGSVPWCG